MLNLRMTDTGIYYIYDYIPVRKFIYHTNDEVAVSKKIWDYKNGDADALNLFTNELMQAISIMVKDLVGDKIGLVAVPPSKIYKNSTIRTSIWNMENWYKKGITKTNYKCSKRIIDFRTLLKRTHDVHTSHEGVRASYEEHLKSISCVEEHLSNVGATFIILDDVTTIGTSMDVCRDILIGHGAEEKHILRLAIAKTV